MFFVVVPYSSLDLYIAARCFLMDLLAHFQSRKQKTMNRIFNNISDGRGMDMANAIVSYRPCATMGATSAKIEYLILFSLSNLATD